MQRKAWFVAAVILAGLRATAASAQSTEYKVPPTTTADLVALCTQRSNDPQADAAIAYCYGYAEGAVDIVLSYTAAGKQSQRPICVPSPAPALNQVMAEFVAWAGRDSANLQKPATAGLVSFLVTRFPCPKTGSGR